MLTRKTMTASATLMLFGMAGAAHADLVFQQSDAYVYADDEIGDPVDDFYTGPGFFEIEAVDGAQESSVKAAPLSLELDTFSGDTGIAFAVDVVSYFFVDSDTTMTVSWDFDGNTRYESGRIIFTNDDTGDVLLDVDFDNNLPDAIDVFLEVGPRYRISAHVASTDGAGSSSAHFVIPAPGSALLFGGGLLMAARRRRA